MPPFLGWGAYAPEGLLVTCSYDYLKQEWNELTFMYYAFAFNYTVPMLTVIFFYIQIVKAVVAHEAAMKAQANKMNVDSLKSNQKDNEASAEVKIAKVAITNVLLWIVTWTPYAIVAMIGVFGNQMLITPLVAQLPSFLGKGSCQKRFSGFCPLRGGYPPCPLSFFEHTDCPLRGGGVPPNSVKEKIR